MAPCRVPRQTAIDLLVKNSHKFCGDELPLFTDEIWKLLAEKTKYLWDVKCWWVNVKGDRRGILTAARDQMGLSQRELPQEETPPTDSDYGESESSISEACNSENENGEVWFDLYIDKDEWNEMKPVENDVKRTNNTLKPKVWANIVSIAMWRQWRLPCAYVFHSAAVNVSDNRKYYIQIKGHCSSKKCGNNFRGYVDDEPSTTMKELHIRVKTRDTTGDEHEKVTRPLNGQRRRQIGKEAVAEGGASNVKKRLARENLKRGDIGQPNEPSLDVIRHAKKEAIVEDLGTNRVKGEDMIQTIERMKYEQEFIGSILDTGCSPFFSFYGTSEQKSAYKQYRHMHRKTATISIDSTGSVVKKLKRPLTLESAHIFLYTIMIHFDKSSISFFQMLSESQEAEKAEFWLRIWQRTVDYQKPNEVVIDGSKALRTACCRALNDLHIKHYISICFEAVSKGQSVPRNLISTFIRLDTSHFIQVWCRLDCLNNHPVRQVRDFYIRLIAIMMDCQHFHDFLEVFILTCIVSSQEFDDSTLQVKSTQQLTQTTSEARVKLEDMIKERPLDVDEFLKILDLDDELIPPIVDADDVSSNVADFFLKLHEEAANVKCKGTRPNFYRLPAFGEKLLEYSRIFPLWTSACLPYYAEHATSSYSERGFREIKREMLKKYALPQDVDNFLRIHLRDLIGGSKIFSGEMLNFRAQGKKVPEPKMKEKSSRAKAAEPCDQEKDRNDSDEGAEENWRNKATSYVRFKAPDLDSTEYSVFEPESSEEGSQNVFEESYSDSRVEFESVHTSASSDLPESTTAFSESLIEDQVIPTTESSTPLNSTQRLTEPQLVKFNPGKNPKKAKKLSPTNDIQRLESHVKTANKPPNPSRSETSSVPSSSESLNKGEEFDVPETPSPILIESNNQVRTENSTYSRVKKPSNAKFFASCPEAISNLHENTEINSKRRPKECGMKRRNYLLKNSAHCGTYKIDGVTYFMRRTCAFDSLASILVTAALDDRHYRTFMEQADTEVLKFIQKFAKTGTNTELYKERFLLLKPLYESTKSVTSMNDVIFTTSYVATDNPTDLWVKLCEFIPSTFHFSTCDASICDGDDEHKVTIQIDHAKILQKGYQALENALDFHHIIYNKQCGCGLTCTETSIGNNHVYVELGSRTHYNQRPKSVKLGVIPHELELDTKYRLVGIICEREDHFTAFCRRASGHWQEYDDLRSSVRLCKSTEQVSPIGAIYIKILGDT